MTNDNEKLETRSPLARTKEYRSYATLGGGFFGALIGLVAVGPQIATDGTQIWYIISILFGVTAVGAFVGFFAIQLFIGQIAAHGPMRHRVGSEENFHDLGNHHVQTGHVDHADAWIENDR